MIVGICDDESRIRDILENKVRRLMPQARIVKFSSCDNLLLCSMSLDILLLDIQMPGMDGMEATGRIRALGGPSVETPIIALTANAADADARRYRAAGMAAVVCKPLDPAALLTAIRMVMAEPASLAAA